jgi:hypothetical protein
MAAKRAVEAKPKPVLADLRSRVSARLEARRAEIEATVHARMRALSDPSETGDPSYVEGLRTALTAAFDYAIAGVRATDGEKVPIPAPLLEQARLAAQNAVGLDTVLRRYFTGYTLLGDFMMQEGERESVSIAAVQRLMRTQASHLDHLISAVTVEHTAESERRSGSTVQRRLEQVEQLLDGELIEADRFDYDFDNHHIGLIAQGVGVSEVVRHLAQKLDLRLMHVRRDELTIWAWLGTVGRVATETVYRAAEQIAQPELRIILGEPAFGLSGWRLTHRQARATAPIAAHEQLRVTRYREVAVLASILSDEVLAASLRELYLEPLAKTRDRGAPLFKTLHAYFAAERNVSSAAAALGVSRQTVINRLSAIEECLGHPLGGCALEMEAALRLEELERTSDPSSTGAVSLPPDSLQIVKVTRASLGTSPMHPVTLA